MTVEKNKEPNRETKELNRETKEPGETGESTKKHRGSLSLTDLILFGLGNVVGAGIFIIISKSIFYGGNKSLYALLTVAAISIVMGFCYIEIGRAHV